MKPAITFAAVFLASLVLAGGCRAFDDAKPSPKHLTPEQMVGRYTVAESSHLMEGQAQDGTLELRADMTFVMEDMPGSKYPGQLLDFEKRWSGHGVWRIIEIDNGCDLDLEFKDLNGKAVSYTDGTPRVFCDGDRIFVSISICDPDEDNYIRLDPQPPKYVTRKPTTRLSR